MNLVEAKEQVKELVAKLGVFPEDIIFVKMGPDWVALTDEGTREIGENEALDYIKQELQCRYIIVNDLGGFELRVDVSEEEKQFLKSIYQLKAVIEDYKESINSVLRV